MDPSVPALELSGVLVCGGPGSTPKPAWLTLSTDLLPTETYELLGLLLAVPGRALKMAAGVLGLIPVSYVAHLTVLRFLDQLGALCSAADFLFASAGGRRLHACARPPGEGDGPPSGPEPSTSESLQKPS